MHQWQHEIEYKNKPWVSSHTEKCSPLLYIKETGLFEMLFNL